MIKKLLILGEKDPTLLALLGIIKKQGNSKMEIYFPGPGPIFEKETIKGCPGEILVIINAGGNTSARVNQWLWKEIRLNEKKIGKEMAGAPVIVLGQEEKFLETPEGKVFRDFPLHHKYLVKPIDLQQFLAAIENIYPVNPYSLCVIKGDAPGNLAAALEHDIVNIIQTFGKENSDKQVKKRFREIEILLENYARVTKNKKNTARLKKEIKRLKEQIIKSRGEKWQKEEEKC